MAGTFRTDSSFFIKGHGLFIRGQIASGTVEVGGMVAIPDRHGRSRHERITRVELGTASDAGGTIQRLAGLQLGALGPADIALVRALLTPGMELRVADPEPGFSPPTPA